MSAEVFLGFWMVRLSEALYLPPRLIGHSRAAELLLLGSRFCAAQALDWGLINEISAEGEVVATDLQETPQLAEQPAAAE